MNTKIDETKDVALGLAVDTKKSSVGIKTLYKELHLKHCENWHGLQKMMDEEFKDIAKNLGTTFSCENDTLYCVKCDCCSEYNYCHDNKEISQIYKSGLGYNLPY